MKKYTNWIGSLILIIGVISCSKDLGDYDYQEINEVEVLGIQEEYSAFTGQRLHIEPSFLYTLDQNPQENNYSYEWFASRDNNISRKVTLSTEKNLDVDIPLLPGSYACYFRVTDRSTGVMFQKQFNISVTTEIATGWLVMNDIGGQARLDMLNWRASEESFVYYQDILKSANSVQLTGKPKLVNYIYKRDPFNSSYIECIYVGTDRETINILNNNYNWTSYRNLKVEVMRNTPPDFHAEKIISMGVQPGGSGRPENYLFDSEGIVTVENVTQTMMHGSAVNRLAGGVLRVSPYLAPMSGSTSPYLVMYDTQNKRFLVHRATNTTALVPSADPALFNPADVGMDLLYMDYTPALSGQFYALFIDAQGKVFLTRFVANAGQFSPLVFEEVTGATGIQQADFYTIDPSQGYLMYSVGPKIYQYDPFLKTTKEMLNVGSRKITLMKYHKITRHLSNARYSEYAKKLMVCTYDESAPETSGKVELYTVPSLNGDLSLYQSYEGFGKIVDVSYRE